MEEAVLFVPVSSKGRLVNPQNDAMSKLNGKQSGSRMAEPTSTKLTSLCNQF